MKRYIEKMQELGWWANTSEKNYYEIGKESPAGHDFFVGVHFDGTPNDFLNQLDKVCDDFDVSYETYLWLDEEGHGRRDAPWDMRDLYNDIEFSLNELIALYDQLCDFYDKCEEEDAEEEYEDENVDA